MGWSSATRILSSVLWHLRGATKDHVKTTGVVPGTGDKKQNETNGVEVHFSGLCTSFSPSSLVL